MFSNQSKFLKSHHRLALPLLAPAFSHLRINEDVTICSTSGWAHGARTSERKVVYCHTPARWLYQSSRYLGSRYAFARLPLQAISIPLRHWDRIAALSAHRYLVNSTAVCKRVADLYGIEAEILPPAPGFTADGPVEAVRGIDAGFILCVSRLLEYKNVEQTIEAFATLPHLQLVVVGEGPLRSRLEQLASKNVILTGRLDDAQLRSLYQTTVGLIAPSYEDFGLTPLEAALFAKPTAALRWGGYLDTVLEGNTGVYFDDPSPTQIATAITTMTQTQWNADDLAELAVRHSRERFVARVRAIVREELSRRHG